MPPPPSPPMSFSTTSASFPTLPRSTTRSDDTRIEQKHTDQQRWNNDKGLASDYSRDSRDNSRSTRGYSRPNNDYNDNRRDYRDRERLDRDNLDSRDQHNRRRNNSNNNDNYRHHDDHGDNRRHDDQDDRYFTHFSRLTNSKGNLYQSSTSNFYKDYTYDHLHRLNRPRASSGWDVVGTPEEQKQVQNHFAISIQSAPASSRSGGTSSSRDHNQNNNYDRRSYHESSKDLESDVNSLNLAIALLPQNIQKILNLTPDPESIAIIAAIVDQSSQFNPQIDTDSMLSNIDTHHSSNPTLFSMNQISGVDNPTLTPHQLHQLFNTSAEFITTNDGKNLRPKVYVSGFPPTGISQDRLKEQLSTIIYQNLFQLEGRTPPRDCITPYTQQTAIRAIHCHPAFVFVEFSTLADGAAALSLNGLPVELTSDFGDRLQVVLQFNRPKDLSDHYTRHPPQHFIHPVIQDLQDKEKESFAKQYTETASASAAVADGHKIYIGNIDQGVSESDLRALFDSIPNLIAFNIPRPVVQSQQQQTQQKVYGFATYSTLQSAEDAVNKFHSQHLGSRPLVVKHTMMSGNTNDDHSSSAFSSLANNQNTVGSGHLFNSGGTQIPFVVSELPTEYIAMYNLIDLNEFNDEKDDVLLDLIEGPAASITKILAVRYRTADHPSPSMNDMNTDVCIFLQCEDQLKASQVLNTLHGKKFGDRAVQVKFIDSFVWTSIPNKWSPPA